MPVSRSIARSLNRQLVNLSGPKTKPQPLPTTLSELEFPPECTHFKDKNGEEGKGDLCIHYDSGAKTGKNRIFFMTTENNIRRLLQCAKVRESS